MKEDEKQLLEHLANKVGNALKKEALLLFTSVKKIEAISSQTGGWQIEVGTFKGYKLSAEIWLDEFTQRLSRKVYYGLRGSSNAINMVADLSKPHIGEPISHSLKDIVYIGADIRLKNKLSDEYFDRPIIEHYKDHFYGFYEAKSINTKNISGLTNSIVGFFVSIDGILFTEKMKRAQGFNALENLSSLKQYLYRKRDRFIANHRKQTDNYICQICCFDFVKAYGELGRNYAEAHHIVPLGKGNKPRNTTIDDLITVCSNCHSMLDKMKGTVADIETLKKIVRKRKTSNC